jgi:hypothetical protein
MGPLAGDDRASRTPWSSRAHEPRARHDGAARRRRSSLAHAKMTIAGRWCCPTRPGAVPLISWQPMARNLVRSSGPCDPGSLPRGRGIAGTDCHGRMDQPGRWSHQEVEVRLTPGLVRTSEPGIGLELRSPIMGLNRPASGTAPGIDPEPRVSMGASRPPRVPTRAPWADAGCGPRPRRRSRAADLDGREPAGPGRRPAHHGRCRVRAETSPSVRSRGSRWVRAGRPGRRPVLHGQGGAPGGTWTTWPRCRSRAAGRDGREPAGPGADRAPWPTPGAGRDVAGCSVGPGDGPAMTSLCSS